MHTPQEKLALEQVLTIANNDFKKGLNAHAFFKLHDKAMSEDLVQNTYLKTWSYLVKGGKIEVMKAFLYHVLNNLIIDEYRKTKALSLDTLVEAGYEPVHTDETESVQNILDGKSAILLIARLPIAYQTVMCMRYIQDLSLTEMSLITGKSKNTMAVQVHRGLEKLKLIYKEV